MSGREDKRVDLGRLELIEDIEKWRGVLESAKVALFLAIVEEDFTALNDMLDGNMLADTDREFLTTPMIIDKDTVMPMQALREVIFKENPTTDEGDKWQNVSVKQKQEPSSHRDKAPRVRFKRVDSEAAENDRQMNCAAD